MTLGFLIRKVKEEDRDDISALVASAFERKDEAALLQRLWAEHAIKIERLAEIGGMPVGYCAFTPVSSKPGRHW